MIVSRRNILRATLAAPAIIAIDRIMPVKLWKPEGPPKFYTDTLGRQWILRTRCDKGGIYEMVNVHVSDALMFTGFAYFDPSNGLL